MQRAVDEARKRGQGEASMVIVNRGDRLILLVFRLGSLGFI